MILGLTGNIATGKSTVFKRLTQSQNIKGFDADQCVYDLYKEEAVIKELVSLFGKEVLDDGGNPVRSIIRREILKNPELKKELEGVFHPRVQDSFHRVKESLAEGEHLVADIPLLFEKDVAYPLDRVIVVACSSDTQFKRLRLRSKLDIDTTNAMIASQVSISHKISLADHVIWNEGCHDQLERQIDTLIHHIF